MPPESGRRKMPDVIAGEVAGAVCAGGGHQAWRCLPISQLMGCTQFSVLSLLQVTLLQVSLVARTCSCRHSS